MKALLRYLVLRKDGEGPFFRLDGKPLSRRDFVREVKTALESAGMPSGAISGHSFCIGAATAAAKGGATESQIKDMGRWKSEATCGWGAGDKPPWPQRWRRPEAPSSSRDNLGLD